MMDTRKYIVELPDGMEAEYSANVIAANMWTKCDVKGNEYLLMESIIDDKTDGHAVQKVDGFTYLNGIKHCKEFNQGLAPLHTMEERFGRMGTTCRHKGIKTGRGGQIH